MAEIWIIIIAILVSFNGSLIGTFLVLRKSTMIGDAISHAVLPGIVISYLVTNSLSSITMICGATLTGLLSIFMIGFFNKMAKIQIDASIGIVFTFLFALGVILLSLFTKKADLDQECVLFGEILYAPLNLYITKGGFVLGPKSFFILSIMLLLNITIISIFFKKLTLTSFDENFANTLGINTKFWNYVILILTTLTTVASFESVGIILILSFLTIPSASAYLFAKNTTSMIFLGCFFGLLISVIGYYLANYYNVSISGSMACTGGVLFTLCFCTKKIFYS